MPRTTLIDDSLAYIRAAGYPDERDYEAVRLDQKMRLAPAGELKRLCGRRWDAMLDAAEGLQNSQRGKAARKTSLLSGIPFQAWVLLVGLAFIAIFGPGLIEYGPFADQPDRAIGGTAIGALLLWLRGFFMKQSGRRRR